MCPGLKPVPPTSRIDRVFDLIVNEYSTFIYSHWKLPKGNWIEPILMRRHFRSICQQKFCNDIDAGLSECRPSLTVEPGKRVVGRLPGSNHNSPTRHG